MAKLHDFAHNKTEECFEWMFSQGTNISKKLKDIDNVEIDLNFQEDTEHQNDEPVKKPKNEMKKDQYLNKF